MSRTPRDVGVAIYFSDFFDVEPEALEEYGAFNISLVSDMPLFVDPFLLFNSDKEEYQTLHHGIIKYLQFLLDKSRSVNLDPDSVAAWFRFKEVRENWLGFSRFGNAGSGLGAGFAKDLHLNLASVFSDFGSETITRGSHLEKLCLIKPGVGADNISDFTVCLIKDYLLAYTEEFAKTHISEELVGDLSVQRSVFNYETESWMSKRYTLPKLGKSFVILSPVDLLTRDDTWISRADFMLSFDSLAVTLPNDALRGQLNQFFRTNLVVKSDATAEERNKEHHRVVLEAIKAFPAIIEYYILEREESGDEATAVSADQVSEVFDWFVKKVSDYVGATLGDSGFYGMAFDSYAAAMERLLFLKHFIEHRDGYRIFYHDGEPLEREFELQLLYKLTWFATPFDVNAEVNNGRGPVDFKVSWGSRDTSLVEFKLAKNKKLKQGLQHQLVIYQEANETERGIWAIFYFSQSELDRVNAILEELEMAQAENIVLIDCREDNKPSASVA